MNGTGAVTDNLLDGLPPVAPQAVPLIARAHPQLAPPDRSGHPKQRRNPAYYQGLTEG